MPEPPPGYVSQLQNLPLDRSLALVFPGQGSQKVGMGLELLLLPAAAAVSREADAALGFPLTELCFRGPDEDLTRTVNAQPALLATSIAYLAAHLESGTLASRPAFLAGHSLGEFTALVAAGSLTLRDALLLVRQRGRLMERAGAEQPGAMAAVVALDEATVEDICRRSGAEMCNYNAPGQIVIGGRPEAVQEAARLAKEAGGRGLPLNVAGAFHTSLMQSAAVDFAAAVDAARISDAAIAVISNVTAQPLTAADAIRADLKAQLTSPVRWSQSVDTLVSAGVTRVTEVGAGRVLIGQIKRSHPQLELSSTEGNIASGSGGQAPQPTSSGGQAPQPDTGRRGAAGSTSSV